MRGSKDGCWTCRVRRKKCDASGMPCAACRSRNIRCDGYGEKPEWMDRGPKERQRAQDVQREIRAARKRGLRLSSPSIVVEQQPRVEDLPLTSLVPHQYWTTPSVAVDHDIIDHQLCRTPSPPCLNTPPSSQRLHPFDSAIMTFPRRSDTFSTIVSDSTWSNDSLDDLNFLWNYEIPQETTIRKSSLEQEILDELEKLFTGEIRDHMHYYIDYVFPSQFPYYVSETQNTIRRWLLRFAHKDPAFLHSCLSLSASHQLLTTHHDVTSVERSQLLGDMRRYRVLAIKEIGKMTRDRSTEETTDFAERMRVIVCAAQLVSSNIFRDDVNDWATHLQTATSSLSFILHHHLTSSTIFTTDPQIGDEWIPRSDQWTYGERKIVELFGSTVLSIDILSNSLMGTPPKLADEYRSLLGNNTYSLLDIAGVEKWVLLVILEITLLEDWKRRQSSEGILSIRELANRVSIIETSLQARLQFYQSTNNSSGSRQTVVTCIFASAALIHLYVVASGARSGVPEIQEAVSHTLALFSEAHDSKTVRLLMWPYCISACLARREQRQRFRDILGPLDGDKTLAGKLLNIRSIIEECWSMSDDAGESLACDWRTSMDRLDLHILVI